MVLVYCAVQTAPNAYTVWVRRDCEGTPHATSYRTWFHFSLTGAARGATVVITVANMNKQAHLYRFGFKPVVKAVPSRPQWEHLTSAVTYEVRRCGSALPTSCGLLWPTAAQACARKTGSLQTHTTHTHTSMQCVVIVCCQSGRAAALSVFRVEGIFSGKNALFITSHCRTSLLHRVLRACHAMPPPPCAMCLHAASCCVCVSCLAQATDTDGSITFSYKVVGAADTLYFAFCFPKSFAELRAQLDAVQAAVPESVYLTREVVTYSLDGRPMDMLTVRHGLPGRRCGRRLSGALHGSLRARVCARAHCSLDTRVACSLDARVACSLDTRVVCKAGGAPSDPALCGRLQITSHAGKLAEREDFIPSLFPEGGSTPRPHRHGPSLLLRRHATRG